MKALRLVHGKEIFGVEVDAETRCGHWHSPVDIIAIRFKCCGRWYPCFDCHAEAAGHEPAVWRRAERMEKAIFCGGCGAEISIDEYLACENLCPACERQFNPGCSKHYHLYFE